MLSIYQAENNAIELFLGGIDILKKSNTKFSVKNWGELGRYWRKDSDDEPNDNYELVKWNGKYGDEARFIVKYNKTGKFTLFTPDHIEDIVWVDQDLSQIGEYKNWEDFGGETVDYLENVTM